MNNETILRYLDINQPFEYLGQYRHSSLIAALRECRLHTGRYLRTGKLIKNFKRGYPGHWLGAIGYLTVLDQIGGCFKNSNSANKPDHQNSIEYALNSFALDLLDNEQRNIDAIVSLRNAFSHDFNLLNVQDNPNRKLRFQHRFSVYWAEDNCVVNLRTEQWDGDIGTKEFKKPETATRINLYELGNLVERIYIRITQGVGNKSIEPQLDSHTFLNKYTFVVY